MNSAIQCKGLTKSYRKTEAVKSVDLTIHENKIYGLLGRNGAGKTTLLNLICSGIIRDSGEVKIYGEEVFENSHALENICFVKEKGFPVEDKKVEDIFVFASILYKNWDEEYKKILVKEFKLNAKKKYKNLSRGTQSIVGLIIGLASRAKITIFDEPSLGLDAAAREKFYNLLLQDYEINPKTIIISTHLIDEVSNMFEEVIILNNGEVMMREDVVSLLEKARFISGKEEVIMPLIKDKKIIHKESFGATSILGVWGSFTDKEQQLLRENNLEISPMPLQKLFIYLTEEC